MKDKMTWEETILFIRKQNDFKDLVEKAYFEENLSINVERFKKSDEFIETLQLIKTYLPNANLVLDIGSGNGISAVAFALEGYNVVCIEPDPSETIGAGAIRKLKDHYNLSNLEIHQTYAEEIQMKDSTFDIVYARQCMHHAYDLRKFVSEASRVLKKGGLFLTIRDHVIFDEKDKSWFLEYHPLQKFYGGENAFSPTEYRAAMEEAGLEINQEIKYYDSVINYFPTETKKIKVMYQNRKEDIIAKLKKKIGLLSKIKLIQNIVFKLINFNLQEVYDERKIPGRMYSYLCVKK